MSVPRTIPEMFADLYRRIEQLESKSESRKRKGVVREVNAAEGWARVELGEDPVTGEPMLSPKVPWEEMAMGAMKWHTPPSVGEQVSIESENGEWTDASIKTSLPSDANKRPHDKGDEHVRAVGNLRILEKDGELHITVGGSELIITASEIRMKSAKIVIDGETHLGGDGGALLHRKGDADSHGDTAVGSASKVYAL